MAIASDSFTGVDLSRLPAPDAVELLDFETIFAAASAQFQALCTAVGLPFDATVESDPVVKLLQLFCYRELALRQRVNDTARAVMVAFATGADLDHLAALFGVERFILTPADPLTGTPAVLETDDDFRRRLVLAPEGYSVAGPEGAYIFHALSADGGVLDASVQSPEPDDIRQIVLGVLDDASAAPELVAAMTAALDAAAWPGEVTVAVLARSGDGSAPSPLLDTVDAALTAESVRPLTDHVTVVSAEIIPFTVEATLTFLAGPDRAVVLASAQARLDAHLADIRRLGRDVTRAGIIAALCPPGVQNVALAEPPADIPCTRLQAGHCTGIVLTDGGVAE